jgi:hypothetical protein
MTDKLKSILAQLSGEERLKLFQILRLEFPIRSTKLETEAEVIVEAIDRASDLTLRGIRGVIAEAAFATSVVKHLNGWRDETPAGNTAYDFALKDATSTVRVQVKLQRRIGNRPLLSDEAPRRAGLIEGAFVVEIQRTRGGKNSAGESTRPYRFGEFDILAVCMQPSTGLWSRFMYTVASWLIPSRDNPDWIQTYQPVSAEPDECWTSDFLECVEWFRSGVTRRLPHVRR